MAKTDKTDKPEVDYECKICLDHYGSKTCLAPGEAGHGLPAPASKPKGV